MNDEIRWCLPERNLATPLTGNSPLLLGDSAFRKPHWTGASVRAPYWASVPAAFAGHFRVFKSNVL